MDAHGDLTTGADQDHIGSVDGSHDAGATFDRGAVGDDLDALTVQHQRRRPVVEDRVAPGGTVSFPSAGRITWSFGE
ncbi:MAG: hypothetical protein WKF60_02920 [Ilumatobacter sp.]